MSRTRSINFSLTAVPRFDRLLAALQERGVEMRDEDPIQNQHELWYLITERDGDYEWKTEPLENATEVFTRLTDALDRHLIVGFRASWSDNIHGGWFLVLPTSNAILFEPYADAPYIEEGSAMIALGWYLDFLLPIMAPFGIRKYKATQY